MLLSLRLPRVAVAGLVGAALVITLGGSVLIDSTANRLGPAPIALAAFIGALVSTSMVYRLASIEGRPSMTHMLLAGIAMNALAVVLLCRGEVLASGPPEVVVEHPERPCE